MREKKRGKFTDKNQGLCRRTGLGLSAIIVNDIDFCVTRPRCRRVTQKITGLLIEGRVGEVDVFLIHALLGQSDGLAKALEVDNLPFTQKTDHIIDVRIIRQTEDIVIGKAGLLLWCDLVRTTFSDKVKKKVELCVKDW